MNSQLYEMNSNDAIYMWYERNPTKVSFRNKTFQEEMRTKISNFQFQALSHFTVKPY